MRGGSSDSGACASSFSLQEHKDGVLPPVNAHSFPHLTPDEIDVIIGKDREGFFTSGLTLGKKKCSVIRDSLHVEGDWTMDIRTKSHNGEPTYNVSIGRAGKVLVIVMGKEGTHGGSLNKKAFGMAEYLRKVGY
ncbi:profilin 2a isoform X3 [Onychostoma macrolepis]|uniref:profilin 2a isoform X3 n=1 Tax=Onychostoma macrolepis TaxID=369639 RepID=UPI002729A9BE|nr:profilin 2a isoform X3 [Onychostoma macrolepis]